MEERAVVYLSKCLGKIQHFPKWQFIPKLSATMINILKFQTLVACQKGFDKQHRPKSDCFWRSTLTTVFSVCYSDKYSAISSPENQHFIWEQKEINIWNSRTFMVLQLKNLSIVKVHYYRVPTEIQKHNSMIFPWFSMINGVISMTI